MKTLKEYFKENKKEYIYDFYKRINNKPLDYAKITREEIYDYIIKSYIDDPEIILRLCNIEEINILKRLLENNLPKVNNGYIEYLLIKDLLDCYLIFSNDKEYYIPEDLINPIKMAMNLFNENEYSLKDVTDSVILGLVRIRNVIEIEEFINYLKNYNIIFTKKSLEEYLNNSLRNNNKLEIIKYKDKEYIVSLEHIYYLDILDLGLNLEKINYNLEEVISIGKYKINLFQEKVFEFLSFLEHHLEQIYIDLIIEDLIVYTGLAINNLDVLKKMADNIEELYKNMMQVVNYFPVWVSKTKD